MPGTVDSAGAVPAGAVLGDFRLGELLGSGGMGQVYRAEQLSLRRAVVDLMVRVCDGIEAAHRRGILHRDLKPANILVDGGGQPRILDFGLATMLTAEAAEFSVVSGAGGLCGTLAFMAPEQTLGDRDLLDVRTDLYAVGVMLYRLCTGRPPTDLSGPLPAVLERRIPAP